jgi:hypothetical protein
MSTTNENEPEKSTAPVDPGPPDWLKAANAANPPKRILFPKSTIGQSPRSGIGVPVAPAPAEAAPVEAISTGPAPAEPTRAEPTPAEPTLVEPTLVEPTLVEPTLVEPTPVEPTASSAPPLRPAPPAPYPAPVGGAPSTPNPNVYANGVYANSVYANAPTSASRGLSLAALILGCSSLVLTVFYLGLFPAIAAVIVGHIARRRQPASQALWLTGLITGYLALGISVFLGGWIVLIFIQAFTAPLG